MRVACTTLYGGRDFVEELETEKHKNEFPAQNRQIHLDTGTGERREERRSEQCIQHRDEREEEKGRERERGNGTVAKINGPASDVHATSIHGLDDCSVDGLLFCSTACSELPGTVP